MKFHCRIDKFNFQAYQYGKDPVPDAVPVALLERKVGPAYRDHERVSEVEVVPSDGGKPRVEIVRNRVRERITRQSLGRSVMRNVLEVEADSPYEAEAIYRRAIGINPEGTSRQIEVVAVEEGATATTPPGAAPKGKRKISADEAARMIVGGVPAEE